eukprot:c5505_g1_i1.p1 GENE.c5505_g1_i1~~c5505_g1_i1.p1  ORF type:complete len:624 (+),score=120.41 c5505_g1_i1:203-1873(+)
MDASESDSDTPAQQPRKVAFQAQPALSAFSIGAVEPEKVIELPSLASAPDEMYMRGGGGGARHKRKPSNGTGSRVTTINVGEAEGNENEDEQHWTEIGQVPAINPTPMTTRSQRRRNRMAANQQLRKLHSEHRQNHINQRIDELGDQVRNQLQNMKFHRPYFTYTTAFIQILVMISALLPITGGGHAHWGVSPKSTNHKITSFDSSTVTEKTTEASNMWFGPTTRGLLHWGVKYTPCMRHEDWIDDVLDSTKEIESSFGCCQTEEGRCAMMNGTDCYDETWTFHSEMKCDRIDVCDEIVLRPCCFGLDGQCAVVAEDYCNALDGMWHDKKQLCSEVNCMEGLCGLGGFHGKDPDQWWRLITPIFMHIGVIHLVFNLVFQLRVCAEIEETAGLWRTAAMYMISGIGGNVIASIFSPRSVSAGSSGALYGMIGVMTVDLFQTWQLLENKTFQLFRLIGMLVLVLGIGTLPWIDNWAHLGGFLVGVLCGIALLPFISFGKWDQRFKLLFRLIAVVALATAATVGIALFYKAPDPGFCSWCHYVDCVPYTSSLCKGASRD